MTNTPTLTLSGGTQIPVVGLGTWPMDDAEAERVIAQAIELGYRHLDTAENYDNERGVGRGVRASGVDRAELFVTTKFNRRWHADAAAGLAGNLERLGLEYVDLLLIHWPNPDQDRYVDAWRTMMELREAGLARAIGTSNSKPAHLDRLIAETGVAPAVNQIECHPYFDRAAERAYHSGHGIVTAAWSPLGRGNGLLSEPLVLAAAHRHGVTPGQVLLAWGVRQGMVTIPKSSDPGRLAANLASVQIELDADEIAGLSALQAPEGLRMMDSDRFGH